MQFRQACSSKKIPLLQEAGPAHLIAQVAEAVEAEAEAARARRQRPTQERPQMPAAQCVSMKNEREQTESFS